MMRAALMVMRRAHRMKRTPTVGGGAGGASRVGALFAVASTRVGGARGCVSTPVPRSASTFVCATS